MADNIIKDKGGIPIKYTSAGKIYHKTTTGKKIDIVPKKKVSAPKQKDISDIDILVEFYEPIGFFAFLDLEEYLTGLFNTKVDLVSKKALKPRIGKYILQEMISV